MKTNKIFSSNQQYLSAFFTLAGMKRRGPWEEPSERPTPPRQGPLKPLKLPGNQVLIENFQLKVKLTLKAGVDLPLERLGKKHKLSFPEKAILAYFAGTELYRAHVELASMINRFEERGIAPAFDIAKLIYHGSTLVKKKIIVIGQRDFPSRFCPEEASLNGKIFTLITGLELK